MLSSKRHRSKYFNDFAVLCLRKQVISINCLWNFYIFLMSKMGVDEQNLNKSVVLDQADVDINDQCLPSNPYSYAHRLHESVVVHYSNHDGVNCLLGKFSWALHKQYCFIKPNMPCRQYQTCPWDFFSLSDFLIWRAEHSKFLYLVWCLMNSSIECLDISMALTELWVVCHEVVFMLDEEFSLKCFCNEQVGFTK